MDEKMNQLEPRSPPPLLDGYLTDDEAARQRGKSTRALRDERQRGIGPPYTRDGRRILYPVDGFRDWLRANERLPVRAVRLERSGDKQAAVKTDHCPALKPRGARNAPAARTGGKRALEETA
jgi:hypothetical protein